MAIIGNIRKHSWIAVVVVGVALAAFIIGDIGKRKSIPTDVGTINGEAITADEYKLKIEENEKLFMQQQQREPQAEERLELQEQVWGSIVETNLMNAEYNKLGINVTTAEMNDLFYGDFPHQFVVQNFTDPATGVFNRQQVVNIINNFENYAPEFKEQWANLEKGIRQDRVANKFQSLVVKSFYTPKALGKYLGTLCSNIADVTYTVNSFAEITDDKIKLTDEDFKKYYDAHKSEYKQIEDSRDLIFASFAVKPSAKDIADIEQQVSETYTEFQAIDSKELPIFVTSESDKPYDSTFHKAGGFNAAIDSLVLNSPAGTFIAPRIVGNEWIMGKVLKIQNRPDSVKISQFYVLNNKAGQKQDGQPLAARTQEEAKKIADSITAVLKTNPAMYANFFSTYAPEYTEKQEELQKGGDLGWVPDGSFGLLSEQLLSNPAGSAFSFEIPDGNGYAVILITGKTPEVKKAQVALIARSIEASEATNKEIYEQASKFAANSRTVAQMQEISQKESVVLHNAEYTAKMSHRLPGLNSAREIVRWAYDEKTKKGDVAAQVFTTDDKYIVVGLKTVREKGYASMEDVKTYIEPQVRIEKKAEILIENAKKAIAESKDLSTIAAKLGTTVDTVPQVSFCGNTFGKNGPEMKVLGSIATVSEAKLLPEPIKGSNGVYVVKVEKVSPSQNEMEQQMVIIQMDMANQQKARYVVPVLKEQAKIEDNRFLFGY